MLTSACVFIRCCSLNLRLPFYLSFYLSFCPSFCSSFCGVAWVGGVVDGSGGGVVDGSGRSQLVIVGAAKETYSQATSTEADVLGWGPLPTDATGVTRSCGCARMDAGRHDDDGYAFFKC